jgi:hypothetical protein
VQNVDEDGGRAAFMHEASGFIHRSMADDGRGKHVGHDVKYPEVAQHHGDWVWTEEFKLI